MNLDTETMMIMTAISMALSSVALVFSWRVNRQMPGANLWAYSYLFLAFGSVLFTTKGSFSPLIYIVLPNIFIASGFYLIWQGARVFMEREGSPRLIPIIINLLIAGLFVGFGLEEETMAQRVILMSAVIAVFSFLASAELLRPSKYRSISTRIAGVILLLLGLLFSIRLLTVGMLPENAVMLTGGIHSNYTFIAGMVFNMLVSYAFIVMMNERLNMRLRRLVDRDFLTGLSNRRCVIDAVDRILSSSSRDHGSTSIVMMDLDKFKSINDNYGHQAGDQFLILFASVLRRCFRPTDIIARVGGEEFIAVLPRTTLEESRAAAERLRVAIELESIDYEDEEIRATVSIGVSSSENGYSSFDELYTVADRALYHAKSNGRNRVATITDLETPALPV